MHRFFISPQAIQNDRVILRGTLVHQIRDVLRMKPGDEVVLLDNTGAAYRAELVTLDRDTVRARIGDRWQIETEPRVRVTLYQGLLKGQKFDWVLQKGTEIGVSVFVPLLAERCIVGSLDDVSDARVERWDRIIVEAAEQAGRGVLPNLMPPMLFAHACAQTPAKGLALIPYEGEKSYGLREALAQVPQPHTISLFIGPEGGFTEDEIGIAKSKGVIPVSLGPRILRAETAGLVAASAVLYALGDLG